MSLWQHCGITLFFLPLIRQPFIIIVVSEEGELQDWKGQGEYVNYVS